MRKKNRQYGFTLIELLVTIAIILSITALAIVNIVGTSNKKKEESWVSVKEEIETAASDYFKYNEYLFEGLEGDNLNGYITVGSLVSNDYLNKVSDPRTGKAVSYCTKVKVTKNGRGMTAKVDDDSLASGDSPTSCDDKYSVSVSNAKNAPKIELKYKCTEKSAASTSGWCTDSKVSINATATPVNGSSIKSFSTESLDNVTVDESKSTTTKINCYITSQKSSMSVTFVAESVDGGKTITPLNNLKWDNTGPEGKLEIVSREENYKSKKVYLSLTNAKDAVSGINEDKIKVSKYDVGFVSTCNLSYQTAVFDIAEEQNGSSKQAEVTIYDKAGNSSKLVSDTYKVYEDCIKENMVLDGKPTETIGSCSKTCGGGKSKVTKTYKYKDKKSGNSCNPETITTEKDCNTQACQQLTCPTVTVTGAVKGNGNWYKKGSSDTKVKVTPTAGTAYWSWATDDSSGNLNVWTKDNKGVQTKSLGDGKRKYQIVVYGSDGTSKTCDGDLWIDTEAPKVEIKSIKVYQLNGNLKKIKTFNVTNINSSGKNTPILDDIGGGVVSCLKKGQKYDGYTCEGGSSYSVSDNLTSSKNLYLEYYEKVISGNYCTHEGGGGCTKADSQYPFPVKYKLCATDEAGNKNCNEIKSAFQAEDTHSLYYGYGYSNREFSWNDSIWGNTIYEKDLLWSGNNN